MSRIPLLAGTRLVVAAAPDDAVVLRPPAPGPAMADIGAAVRDALRFPLAGEPLEALVRRRGRATIVVEPPALPIPGSAADPRRLAVGAVVDELERLGIPSGYQTILVACGLARRTTQHELESLVTRELARRFHGHVVIHDAEDPELVLVDDSTEPPLHVNRALVDTELVIAVSSAETVLDGGPATLLAAADARAQREAGASSLLETSASRGWQLGVALERALARRLPVVGVSLVLNHPRTSGALRGYPYEPDAVERIAGSPLRHVLALLPERMRHELLHSLQTDITAAGAYAGPPSVAHAEALLRAVELRRTVLDGPLDAIVVGVPGTTPYLPREAPNPLLAAYLGLGLALRLWRDAFPVVEGGTAVLVHRFSRTFPHPTQSPYRPFFHGSRIGRDPELLAGAERAAATGQRGLEDYRNGRTVHPLLPFRQWDACRPAIGRLGAVLVAGAADAATVRQLGFVPVQSLGVALDLARGRTSGTPRIGFLLGPPYFPLRVGGS